MIHPHQKKKQLYVMFLKYINLKFIWKTTEKKFVKLKHMVGSYCFCSSIFAFP